jgi:hypothetical protein
MCGKTLRISQTFHTELKLFERWEILLFIQSALLYVNKPPSLKNIERTIINNLFRELLLLNCFSSFLEEAFPE